MRLRTLMVTDDEAASEEGHVKSRCLLYLRKRKFAAQTPMTVKPNVDMPFR